MTGNKLDIAKKIIRERYSEATCGIFFCRNFVGDPMVNIYENEEIELCIDICYNWGYFEVFGLSEEEENELENFYESLGRKK